MRRRAGVSFQCMQAGSRLTRRSSGCVRRRGSNISRATRSAHTPMQRTQHLCGYLRLATVENTQRENLPPLDEAAAFAALLRNGAVLDDITAQTGLSTRPRAILACGGGGNSGRANSARVSTREADFEPNEQDAGDDGEDLAPDWDIGADDGGDDDGGGPRHAGGAGRGEATAVRVSCSRGLLRPPGLAGLRAPAPLALAPCAARCRRTGRPAA
jgi:hypothetical protein